MLTASSTATRGRSLWRARKARARRFNVKLPAGQQPPPRAEPAEKPPDVRGRRLRILVVDDEADVRETLREVLEARHEVWEAESGPAALAILERQPVDVAFTDLGMAGMTGWEVADRIKARWPEVKVALVTGWGVRVKPEELAAHGVELLFAKPFQVKEILRALADFTGRPSA